MPQIPTEREYKPIWLNIIKRRNFFIMEKVSFEEQKTKSLQHGEDFFKFLDREGLNVISLGLNQVKIFK
jgi:hypothetical protein